MSDLTEGQFNEDDSGACDLCGERLADGETVVQVVEDRHPTYDREIVLHTYHKSCCQNRETVAHDCPHCGCMFHLAMIRQGQEYQNSAQQLLCPFCGTPFGCSMGSTAGTPSQVSGEDQLPAEKQAEGRVANIAPASLNVDRDLLERQAALLGKVVEGSPITPTDRKCLEGLWEFAHSVLDSLEEGAGEVR
jgi:hypothetical protein